MKRLIIGFAIGALINLTFFLVCVLPYTKEHERIFAHSIIFIPVYIFASSVLLFLPTRRPYAVGGFIALSVPLLLFFAMQIIVFLAYRYS